MSYKFHKTRVDPYPPKENNSMEMGQTSQSGKRFMGMVDHEEEDSCIGYIDPVSAKSNSGYSDADFKRTEEDGKELPHSSVMVK